MILNSASLNIYEGMNEVIIIIENVRLVEFQ